MSQPRPGYVYLLRNTAMSGLLKVGRTTRRPSERASQLSGATGAPEGFELVFDIFVPDCEDAERRIHEELTAKGHRWANNREFFSAPVDDVVAVMERVRDTAPRLAVSEFGSEPSAVVETPIEDISDAFMEERDPLFRAAAEVCIQYEQGSTALMQRRLRIGYGRAARIIDQLHEAGVLGPPDGAHPRDVLVGLEELDRICRGAMTEGEPMPPPAKKSGWFERLLRRGDTPLKGRRRRP